MSPKQRTLGHRLLQSTLSSQGYLKTSGIMHLEELLDEYVHNYEQNIAHIQMDRILKAGVDGIHFAWAGTGKDEPGWFRPENKIRI